MKVLGISPLDKDSTVSIVEDGKVLFAAGEERFSRNKQQSGFPSKALEKGLDYTGLDVSDFDLVAYPFMEFEKEQECIEKNLSDEKQFLEEFNPGDLSTKISLAKSKIPVRTESIHGLHNPNEVFEKNALYKLMYKFLGTNLGLSRSAALKGSNNWATEAIKSFKHWQNVLEHGLKKHEINAKLQRIEHHQSHAANSFLASGFERALCITLDGYGTGLAGSVSEASGGKIKRLHNLSYPNSLGTMYEHVTSSLGFKPSRHEGKIVGLASYGDPEILSDILLDKVKQEDGNFSIYGSNNIFFSRHLASHFPKIDVAAAYQHVLEVVATNYVNHWVNKTGIDTIVLSGGVVANVKLNQRIFELDNVKNIFIYPNMGDGGCGTGAAMYYSWPQNKVETISSPYYGPDYSDHEIKLALDNEGLKYEMPENYAAAVAKLINEGKVVARFNGRMEYGPRALGNRSIMYHAREPEVNQWLNKRLGRTEFMPFAPVTLYEERHKCYHNIDGAEHTAEFMTITFDCTDIMKETCPAAVHVDGTARPQLVRREVNPGYYDIVKEYEKLSGIPSLINTSFNMHEEPIVCSPNDAIRAFLDGNIDWLAIGGFLVQHPSLVK